MGVIYLIRHGQASWGHADYDKLSDVGEKQSTLLGEALAGRLGEVDVVVSGAMRRHRQTAEMALAAMGSDLVPEEDAGWNEFDHEQVIVRHKPFYKTRSVMVADLVRTGDPVNSFQKMFDAALERWVGAGEAAAGEYSESWPAFSERAAGALTQLAGRLGSGGTALVFTSGGPISAAGAHLLDSGAPGWLRLNRVIANCSLTKVVTGRSGLSLVTFNEHAHFEGTRGLLTYR